MPKGFRHSPESRAKISLARLGNKSRLGVHASVETRAKLSAARTGQKHTADTCAKMSAAFKGRKFTPEWRAKLSAAKKGKKPTLAACAKMSVSHKGKGLGNKNTNWRGGLSLLPYAPTFTKQLKESIRRRDGHQCQLCRIPQLECNNPLSVHHIDYDKTNSDPVNLITLCTTCHGRTGRNRKYWIAFFQQELLRRHVGFQLPLPLSFG